ncbi:MAG: DUF1028 domain-containing protein [Saprospiraceae bacterium]|nr:DUF1028 domain-containing protein [Saprospiraceae bacterium]
MKQLLLIAFGMWSASLTIAQDTFSIVAVDTLTGEVGSAGASCLDNNSFPGSGGAIIISDILPGKGAIHTQSYWVAGNQANARLKMEEGLSPVEIITWLRQNDVEGILGQLKRQYGIIDFDAQGHPRSAAHTGTSCFNYKGHKTGLTYSIQGNILLGQQILDSMEARFLNANGTLADRLMAALQGANVPGADTRCLNNGTSSLSAFLRVAKPEDADDNLFLDLNVPSLPAGQEPIDSLQTLYNQWKASSGTAQLHQIQISLQPNPASDQFSINWNGNEGDLFIYSTSGKLMFRQGLKAGENRVQPTLTPGFYLIEVRTEGHASKVMKLVWH